ncbi:hypothetical protein T11_12832 [Trichinella zimbabwensis]|uniref:Reverse transcriptase domain-containing protein n=1 Tax=Trichinella zimbabwensis TaxID=268475 RepID=A0A0V1GUV0_9BILA|nr:hypothetical protein T11_12832 [Trichinella zimbabwensis]
MGAFSTPFSLNHLYNAPGAFQSLMEVALCRFQCTSCLIYLDGIISFRQTEEEHLSLERLNNISLTLMRLNISCEEIFERGTATDSNKTKVEIYKKKFANIAHPLHQVLQKGCRWNWSLGSSLSYSTLSSAVGLGAVLTKISGEEEHPDAYASDTFRSAGSCMRYSRIPLPYLWLMILGQN